MLHLRMRTVEPNHWPSWFHLRGENRNPMVFPWSTDLAHFSSFFHAFSISRVSFLGWVFLILGAKLEHFEAQLWWPPRLRWRPPVRLTSSKKEPGVELERDRTDIKCIYNNNHKIIIIMHNNNNTNIYIIIIMRIRILITLIIINNILYYIYKYNIIKYNIIFASKKKHNKLSLFSRVLFGCFYCFFFIEECHVFLGVAIYLVHNRVCWWHPNFVSSAESGESSNSDSTNTIEKSVGTWQQ